MSDFSDRPFVAGSLIGARAFSVDKLGRLVGPTYPAVFTPGENVAECNGGAGGFLHYQRALMRSLSAPLYGYNISEGQIVATPSELTNEADATPEEPKHQVGTTGCSCGFYAYFDGKSDYSQAGRVTALVEGYGVCTVGTRGFRAEKARLVAIVHPSRRGRAHSRRYDDLAEWCNRHDGAASAIGVPAGLTGASAAIVGLICAFAESAWWAALTPIGMALVFLAAVMLKADFHGIDRAHPTVSDLSRCHDGGNPRPRLVSRNYPDVPVYSSLRAAIAAHPLTPPEPPSLPSPDDEDFWTRAAS